MTEEDGEDGEGDLDGHLLPHVVLGAGRPHQEGAHVLGQLALGRAGAGAGAGARWLLAGVGAGAAGAGAGAGAGARWLVAGVGAGAAGARGWWQV